MVAPLKYAPKRPDLTLKNQWSELKLNDRRIRILANGSSNKFLKRRWWYSVFTSAIAAIFVTGGILALLLFAWGKDIEQSSNVIVGGLFAGGTVVLPAVAWWLLWLIFSRQSHISCRALICFGQNQASDVPVEAVKKKISIARWVCIAITVVSGAAIFGFAVVINDFVVRVCVCAVFNILFATSVYFLILGLRNIGVKAKMVEKYACEGCGYVNTNFFDGSHKGKLGEEETRLVNTNTTSYTAGTVYDNQGNKVGTVQGTATTYAYAVGRSYEFTTTYRCACCGKMHSYKGKGFQEERRYKV